MKKKFLILINIFYTQNLHKFQKKKLIKLLKIFNILLKIETNIKKKKYLKPELIKNNTLD